MIVSVVSQKGGVGKSTVAAALIKYFLRQNLTVCAIDLDVQGSLTQMIDVNLDTSATEAWLAGGSVQPEKVSNNLYCFGASAKLTMLEQDYIRVPGGARWLSKRLALIKNHFDVIVIDTPAGLGGWVIGAMYAADQIVSPCLLESLSFNAMQQFVHVRDQVLSARQYRLCPCFIVPNRYDRRVKSQAKILTKLLQANWGQVTAPIPTCSAINAAIDQGQMMSAVSLGRAQAYFDHLAVQLLRTNNVVAPPPTQNISTIVSV